MSLEKKNSGSLLHKVSSVDSRYIVEDFKHYLDQSCAYNAAKLDLSLSACLESLQSVALLVLVPACSYIQYLMGPSPEPCRNRLTGIISEKHKMAFKHCRSTITVPYPHG